VSGAVTHGTGASGAGDVTAGGAPAGEAVVGAASRAVILALAASYSSLAPEPWEKRPPSDSAFSTMRASASAYFSSSVRWSAAAAAAAATLACRAASCSSTSSNVWGTSS
jgi:hypothetical protein